MFTDVSNQANMLLVSLKEIIRNFQEKNVHFQTQVEKLTIKNQQLIISNKKLCSQLNCLKEDLKRKYAKLVS